MSETGKPPANQNTGRTKWWKTAPASEPPQPAPVRGQACPKCLMADLDLDTLFRLSCPLCGFVASCGAFT